MEWYPTGRLLLWVAAIAGLLAFMTLLTLGTDAEAIAAAMKRGFCRMVRICAPRRRHRRRRHRGDDLVAPTGFPAGPMMTLTVNLWLAGKITRTSGRLNRPWPDLKATALPPMTLVALCVAIAFCFTGGLLSILAKVVTGALLTAYALTGLAVLHTLTLACKQPPASGWC